MEKQGFLEKNEFLEKLRFLEKQVFSENMDLLHPLRFLQFINELKFNRNFFQ